MKKRTGKPGTDRWNSRKALLALLKKSRWNVKKASALSGVGTSVLYKRIKKFGLSQALFENRMTPAFVKARLARLRAKSGDASPQIARRTEAALRKAQGDMKKTAKLLGISVNSARGTLHRVPRLHRLQIRLRFAAMTTANPRRRRKRRPRR